MKFNPEVLASEIKRHRRRSGLTGKAAAMKIGVSYGYFSKVESGGYASITTYTLALICTWLGENPGKFFTNK